LERHRPHCRKPTVTICGTIKTEKDRGTYRKAKPKTDASIRTLVLPRFVIDMLLRRRASEPENDRDAVFATRTGSWHQVGNIERRWRQVRNDSGLEWVTPHVFRKTVATLVNNGRRQGSRRPASRPRVVRDHGRVLHRAGSTCTRCLQGLGLLRARSANARALLSR
jgi:integrase